MAWPQQDGAANGSQPFSSGGKTNVIGGWLPSLTFSFGITMIRNHPIVSGAVAGALVWGAVTAMLFRISGDNLPHHVLMVLVWIPDRLSDWVTMDLFGAAREASIFAFLPLSFAYWVCIGAAGGAVVILARRNPPRPT